jgi:hypothetical protein
MLLSALSTIISAVEVLGIFAMVAEPITDATVDISITLSSTNSDP